VHVDENYYVVTLHRAHLVTRHAATVASSGGGAMADATPITAGSPTARVFAVAFADSLHGIAVGGDSEAPDEVRVNVARTDDGGASWTRGDTTHVVTLLTGVAYLPGSNGKVVVGVGPRGVFCSRDGGATWVGIAAEPYRTVRATRTGVEMVGDRGAVATWDGSPP